MHPDRAVNHKRRYIVSSYVTVHGVKRIRIQLQTGRIYDVNVAYEQVVGNLPNS